MTAQTWKLRLDPTSRVSIENWLFEEDLTDYKMRADNDTLEIELHDITTAFKVRMQFDEELVA